MKRYLVFGGVDYYPCGGMQDFWNDYSGEARARAAAVQLAQQGLVWSHVWDSKERKFIVAFSRGGLELSRQDTLSECCSGNPLNNSM